MRPQAKKIVKIINSLQLQIQKRQKVIEQPEKNRIGRRNRKKIANEVSEEIHEMKKKNRNLKEMKQI